MFAEVIVRRRTRVETLTYAVPAAIAAYIKVGSQVTVSVRRQIVKAVVLKITRQVPRELRSKLKDILAVDKNAHGFSPPQVAVIEKLADYYGASLSEIAFHALAIPSPINQGSSKPSSQKPLFVQAPWPDRVKFYQNIINKHQASKRLVFLFAVEGWAAEFCRHVPSNVELFEGKLTAAQSRSLNAAIAAKKPIIVVGSPKWAFFPLQAGDVLVIDQPDHVGFTSQQRPYLSAKQIGLARATAEGMQLVLGADAPNLHDYLQGQNSGWNFLRQILPTKELTIFSKIRAKDLFLPNFLAELTEAVKSGQKVLVFAASRGWAGALYCRDCQEVQVCSNCGRPVGLRNERELLCSFCSFTGPRPPRCRRGHDTLVSLGEGTTQVVTAVKTALPKASVAELGSDATQLPEAQIIIATEKILSFPAAKFDNLFVASADRLLSGTSAEGAWHLLTIMLALRPQAKNIFVQTHFPDHWLWSAIGTGQFGQFYNRELVERKKYHLPPFGQELQLVGRDKDAKRLQKQAGDITSKVEIEFPEATISKGQPRPIPGGQVELTIQLYRPNHFSPNEKHHLRSLLPPSWTIVIDE